VVLRPGEHANFLWFDSGLQTETITAPAPVQAFCLSGERLIALLADGSLAEIRSAIKPVLSSRLDPPMDPFGLVALPDGRVVVIDRWNGSLRIVDPGSLSVTNSAIRSPEVETAIAAIRRCKRVAR
jgi:hypothetical protein